MIIYFSSPMTDAEEQRVSTQSGEDAIWLLFLMSLSSRNKVHWGNQGVLFEESAFWEELAVNRHFVLPSPLTQEKEKCADALFFTGSFNLQNFKWEQNDFSVWVTALPFTGEEAHVPTIGNTVSSLHTHLQVANFQRCERAFTCPVM